MPRGSGSTTAGHDDAERRRLAEARDARRALATLGSVPVRAAVGHRPRGLQRRRRRLGVLHPRPGAFARLPLGRGRPRRVSPTTSSSLCFALALWNGRDPILKERLFGLTNSEGNHGEDVKEYYFYLDSTPTHSYMKYLYKYPQAAYPVRRSRRDEPRPRPRRPRVRAARHRRLRRRPLLRRLRRVREGLARRHRSSEITATNRGPEAATLHLLPTLWFRNTWSWGGDAPRPVLARPARAGRSSSTPRTRTSASASSPATARPAAVHRERDEHRAALRHARTARRT